LSEEIFRKVGGVDDGLSTPRLLTLLLRHLLGQELAARLLVLVTAEPLADLAERDLRVVQGLTRLRQLAVRLGLQLLRGDPLRRAIRLRDRLEALAQDRLRVGLTLGEVDVGHPAPLLGLAEVVRLVVAVGGDADGALVALPLALAIEGALVQRPHVLALAAVVVATALSAVALLLFLLLHDLFLRIPAMRELVGAAQVAFCELE